MAEDPDRGGHRDHGRLSGSPPRRVAAWTIGTLLDINAEGVIPSWYSSSKLLLVAFMWAIIGIRARDASNANRRFAFLVPALFVLMSADEGAQLHETLGKVFDRILLGDLQYQFVLKHTGLWMFTVGIPAIFVCLLMLRAARRHPPYSALAKGKCLAGFVILFSSAIGLEFPWNFAVHPSPQEWFQVSAEELGEMIGVSLIAWGTWEALVRENALMGDQPPVVASLR